MLSVKVLSADFPRKCACFLGWFCLDILYLSCVPLKIDMRVLYSRVLWLSIEPEPNIFCPSRRWSLTCPSSMKGGPVGDAKNSCWMLQWNHLSEVWGRERTLDSIVEIMDLYKELGLSRLVLQKVVWMRRAAGHFDVSVFLTTHAMIAKLYFCCKWIGLRENLQETIDFPIKYGAIHWCWRACGVLMFWRAPRWPEFLAGLGWGFSWDSALALSHFSCAAIVYDVVQICVPVCTVSFPSGSYTFWRL